jgi:hypothetical protein
MGAELGLSLRGYPMDRIEMAVFLFRTSPGVVREDK